MKRIGLFLASLFLVFAFACTSKTEEKPAEEAAVQATTFATVDEMVEAALKNVTQITAKDVKAKMDAEEGFLLIDVRDADEFNTEFIPSAVNISRGLLEFRIDSKEFWDAEQLYPPKKDELIIVYCKKGNRGALAAQALQQMGFTNVKSIEGGLLKWKEAFPEDVEVGQVAPANTGGAVTKSSGGGC